VCFVGVTMTAALTKRLARAAVEQRGEVAVDAAFDAADVGDERVRFEGVAAFADEPGHGLDRHAKDDDIGLAHGLARILRELGVDAGEADFIERARRAGVDH